MVSNVDRIPVIHELDLEDFRRKIIATHARVFVFSVIVSILDYLIFIDTLEKIGS